MISFDGSIYSKAAVEQACEDYKGIADISVAEKGGYLICDIRNPLGDLRLIESEFANYVLNLTVVMG